MKVFLTTMVQWDCALCLRIFRLNGRTILDAVMYGLSRLGDGYFYALVGIVLFVVNAGLAIQVVPVLLLAFALELIIYKLLKNKTRRNRPFEILPTIRFLMHPPDKFSFPSGHTGAAFVMATILSAFIPALTLPFVLIAVLIGFSRIYNGLHFPSDVIAGMALGVVCAKISLTLIG